MLAAICDMAARASTPQTLVRKRSKGYAPRIVAAGTYATTSDDEDVIFVKEIGAHTAYLLFLRVYLLTMSRRSSRATVKRKLSPPSAAPPPAKVSPPIKSPVVPVIDARLRISSSKVRPLLYAAHQVLPDIVSSLRGLPAVGTILP